MLIWLASYDREEIDPPTLLLYAPLQTVYMDLGIACDVVLDEDTDFWTGNLADYWLVFLDTPASNPSWWPTDGVLDTEWSGRLVMIAEHSGIGLIDCYAWINGLTSLTSLVVVSAEDFSTFTATTSADPLTVSVSTIAINNTCYVEGGTILASVPGGDMLTHNVVTTTSNKIDWVLSGDSGWLTDPSLSSDDNTQLAQNLWPGNVPL